MAIVQSSRIQVRVGNQDDLPVLSTGEFGYAVDTKKLYIGNPDASLPTDNTLILTSQGTSGGGDGDTTVAGNNTEVIFNDYGQYGGSSKFKFESVSSVLSLEGELHLSNQVTTENGIVKYNNDDSLTLGASSTLLKINRDALKGVEFIVNNSSIAGVKENELTVKTNSDSILKMTGLFGVEDSGEGAGITSGNLEDTSILPLTVRGSEIRFRVGTTTTTQKAKITSTGLQVTGTLTATTKNFYINHPTKQDMFLQYGSLEGPENGVYVRGVCKDHFIQLPDYWVGLVDETTITVTLTPIGKFQKLYVEKILNNVVFIGCEEITSSKEIHCYYHIYAERKDVPKLQVEL